MKYKILVFLTVLTIAFTCAACSSLKDSSEEIQTDDMLGEDKTTLATEVEATTTSEKESASVEKEAEKPESAAPSASAEQSEQQTSAPKPSGSSEALGHSVASELDSPAVPAESKKFEVSIDVL